MVTNPLSVSCEMRPASNSVTNTAPSLATSTSRGEVSGNGKRVHVTPFAGIPSPTFPAAPGGIWQLGPIGTVPVVVPPLPEVVPPLPEVVPPLPEVVPVVLVEVPCPPVPEEEESSAGPHETPAKIVNPSTLTWIKKGTLIVMRFTRNASFSSKLATQGR